MRKLIVLLGVLALVIGLSGISSAMGPTLYFPAITDADPITIDGDLGDWAAGGYAPVITADEMEDNQGVGMPSKADLDIAIYAGWSPAENMIYIGVSVTDDFYNADAATGLDRYLDDGVEILIDADHSGGSYNAPDGAAGRCVLGQQYYLTPIPPSGEDPLWIHYDPDKEWAVHPPYAEVAVNLEDPNYTVEAKFVIFDELRDSYANSVPHTLTAGETIGLAFCVDDADETLAREIQASTSGAESGNCWTDGDYVNDVILLTPPVAAEGNSWSAIKSLFR